MDNSTAKISELVNKFIVVTAAHAHYTQIVNLYKAIEAIKNAVVNAKQNDGSEDPKVSSQAERLYQLTRRLLYNANIYGVSAKTSSRYGNEIKRGVDQILSQVRALNPYTDLHTMVGQAAEAAQNTLQAYRPQEMPAQRPKPATIEMPEDKIQAKPPQQMGAAKPQEETFSFGPAGVIQPARLAPPVELPASEDYPEPGDIVFKTQSARELNNLTKEPVNDLRIMYRLAEESPELKQNLMKFIQSRPDLMEEKHAWTLYNTFLTEVPGMREAYEDHFND